jgi:hypothetical protein
MAAAIYAASTATTRKQVVTMGPVWFVVVLVGVALVATGAIRSRQRRRGLLEYVAELEKHPEIGSTSIDGLDHARDIPRGVLRGDRDPSQSSTAIIVGNRHMGNF